MEEPWKNHIINLKYTQIYPHDHCHAKIEQLTQWQIETMAVSRQYWYRSGSSQPSRTMPTSNDSNEEFERKEMISVKCTATLFQEKTRSNRNHFPSINFALPIRFSLVSVRNPAVLLPPMSVWHPCQSDGHVSLTIMSVWSASVTVVRIWRRGYAVVVVPGILNLPYKCTSFQYYPINWGSSNL